jgi:hypothetical protein
MPQPSRHLLFLLPGEPELELTLQHVRRASVARYIV